MTWPRCRSISGKVMPDSANLAGKQTNLDRTVLAGRREKLEADGERKYGNIAVSLFRLDNYSEVSKLLKVSSRLIRSFIIFHV